MTTLTLHNLSGAVVATLLNETLPAGTHTAALDANNLNLANGIYYLRLVQGEKTAVGKVVYVR